MNISSTSGKAVFLVEDSTALRQRMSALLKEIDGVCVVGEADTAAAAVEGILATNPDCVVVDFQLLCGTAVDVLRGVRRCAPQIMFIVLTNHANPHIRRACMEAGACHFLDKSLEFRQVMDIIADFTPVKH